MPPKPASFIQPPFKGQNQAKKCRAGGRGVGRGIGLMFGCNSFICIHYMALINIRFTHAGEYGLPDGARTPRTRCCLAPCSSNFSNQSLLLLHCAYAACAALGFWKFPKGQQCAPFPLMCLFPHLPNYGFRFFGKFCIAKRFLCSNSCCMLAAKIILKFMMTNFQRQLQRFAKPEKRNENKKKKNVTKRNRQAIA